MKNLFFSMIIGSAATGCGGNNNAPVSGTENSSQHAPSVSSITYSVIKTYPHDTSSFTQGLAMYKGVLYEGTGGSNTNVVGSKMSRLLEVNLATGKAEKLVDLDAQYFGEGITILNDTVYQLTWTAHKVFAYTLRDFKKVKEFTINTEGWGITTNGKELIVSDGSSNLYFYDPSSFKLLHTQSVTLNGELAYNVNELEYIDGYIYANVWQMPHIYKIDPNNGLVVGTIDVTGLWQRINQQDPNNVPNGIAYDADTKKIYITGKKWPELYEIQLGQ